MPDPMPGASVWGRDDLILPRGEVYTLLPFADGSSPPKIVDGRAGGDVR